ncbi:low molecular weight protein-tyrosine-phosphatase [Parasulfitobacter algicola]|uniref:protein-tyrosine-phosphatase n=1 Tax=Parasulfitobacter algicola TaxID=2614809 RepID=A0ABX2IWF4_9RHOB|nr:low molecular weight protein-tyrosine-phosphatase [Sulfitobacter algicola]NSX54413.1 low molecular weight phosphotyrosine protein phosphatase [Sulfitobacter algicola]
MSNAAHRILFVCLGNICRSPTAESVFRTLADQSSVLCKIDSAGTSGWHIGDAPYGPMQNAASARGDDLSSLRARQFSASDYDRFDLIIGMDNQNIKDIKALQPKQTKTNVIKLTEYGSLGATYVPDPYYTRDFDTALDIIEDAAQGLLKSLV